MRYILILSLLCLLIGCNQPPSEINDISAGIAMINITPETSIPMSGYGSRKDPFEGIHDSIFARAIVFSDGTNKAVVVSAEIIGLSDFFVDDITKRIEQETGIRRDHILMSVVHNHSGPVTRVYNKNVSPEVDDYVNTLREKLVQLVINADKDLKPASIGAGTGECKMNINRRANDGKGNIQLGRNPYGPCDHEVGVIRIDDEQGNIISLLIDWPCHAVVMGPRNLLICGDWPGAASRYVEDSLGKPGCASILVGASGDINPIYGPHIDFVDINSYAYALDAIGYDLGNEAIRVSNEIKTVGTGEIMSVQKSIFLPGKDDEHNQQDQTGSDLPEDVEVGLTAIRIGDIVLAGINGEVFNQIGVKIRDQSPYPNTFIITHCNGSSGYLVSDAAIPEGGYEVRVTHAKSGAEEGIIRGLLSMIEELDDL
jgi:neutral ceramidase